MGVLITLIIIFAIIYEIVILACICSGIDCGYLDDIFDSKKDVFLSIIPFYKIKSLIKWVSDKIGDQFNEED
jgi:hypothetical protein